MKNPPPEPEADAIKHRLEAVGANHTIRGIVFQALERALTDAAGEDAVGECRALAGLGDQRYDAMTKFPLRDFIVYQQTAALKMSPAVGGFDDAIWKIGAAAVDTFFDSIAGRTMALLAGRDPTRLLSAAPNGYGLLVSHGRRTWRQTSANQGRFSFEDEYLGPVHNLGTFDTALRVAHGVEAEFEIESRSPLDFTFVISW